MATTEMKTDVSKPAEKLNLYSMIAASRLSSKPAAVKAEVLELIDAMLANPYIDTPDRDYSDNNTEADARTEKLAEFERQKTKLFEKIGVPTGEKSEAAAINKASWQADWDIKDPIKLITGKTNMTTYLENLKRHHEEIEEFSKVLTTDADGNYSAARAQHSLNKLDELYQFEANLIGKGSNKSWVTNLVHGFSGDSNEDEGNRAKKVNELFKFGGNKNLEIAQKYTDTYADATTFSSARVTLNASVMLRDRVAAIHNAPAPAAELSTSVNVEATDPVAAYKRRIEELKNPKAGETTSAGDAKTKSTDPVIAYKERIAELKTGKPAEAAVTTADAAIIAATPKAAADAKLEAGKTTAAATIAEAKPEAAKPTSGTISAKIVAFGTNEKGTGNDTTAALYPIVYVGKGSAIEPRSKLEIQGAKHPFYAVAVEVDGLKPNEIQLSQGAAVSLGLKNEGKGVPEQNVNLNYTVLPGKAEVGQEYKTAEALHQTTQKLVTEAAERAKAQPEEKADLAKVNAPVKGDGDATGKEEGQPTLKELIDGLKADEKKLATDALNKFGKKVTDRIAGNDVAALAALSTDLKKVGITISAEATSKDGRDVVNFLDSKESHAFANLVVKNASDKNLTNEELVQLVEKAKEVAGAGLEKGDTRLSSIDKVDQSKLAGLNPSDLSYSNPADAPAVRTTTR